MLYAVDFAIKLNGTFHTIHTAFIEAISVSECQHKAEEMREELPQAKTQHIRIFIEECVLSDYAQLRSC